MQRYEVGRGSRGPTNPAVIEAEVHAGASRTRYLRSGAGPTLLLLHGAGEGPEVWRPWLEGLASRFRVVAPDLSLAGGRVASGRAAGTAGSGGRATWLRDFLDGLGAETVGIVTRGGARGLASSFAADYPERVRELLHIDAEAVALLVRSSLSPPP